jgi:hypothetical protein
VREAIIKKIKRHTKRPSNRAGPPLSLSRFCADAAVQINRDAVDNRVESRQSQDMMPPELELRSSSYLRRPYPYPPSPSVNAVRAPTPTLDSSTSTISTFSNSDPFEYTPPLTRFDHESKDLSLPNHSTSFVSWPPAGLNILKSSFIAPPLDNDWVWLGP